jgi:hypothetical protein
VTPEINEEVVYMLVLTKEITNRIVIFLLFILTQCYLYSQTEKTMWDESFDKFLFQNGNQTVLYTTVSYINDETNELIKALFIYKLSDSISLYKSNPDFDGIILYTDGKTITNFFTVIYLNEYNTIILGDVEGGVWSRRQAGKTLDIVLRSKMYIGICKDLRQLALPDDGNLKF